MYMEPPWTPPRGRRAWPARPADFRRRRDPRGIPREDTTMNRRTVAGVCLIASAVLHTVSYFLWPAGSEGSAATQLASAAAHPGAMTAATLTETAGWLLLLPALVVLWSEVRGRGAALVTVGAWLAILGVAGFVVSGVLNVVTVDLAALHDGTAAYDAIRSDGRVFGTVVVPILLGLVGLVVLLCGLARAGLGGWWMPVAGAVAVVADQVLGDSANPLLLAAAFAPMAAALIAVGLRMVDRRAAVAEPVPAVAVG
jgi:hypothetical protein